MIGVSIVLDSENLNGELNRSSTVLILAVQNPIRLGRWSEPGFSAMTQLPANLGRRLLSNFSREKFCRKCSFYWLTRQAKGAMNHSYTESCAWSKASLSLLRQIVYVIVLSNVASPNRASWNHWFDISLPSSFRARPNLCLPQKSYMSLTS